MFIQAYSTFTSGFLQNPKTKSVTPNGHSSPKQRIVSPKNGSVLEPHDKDVVSEGLVSVDVYDQWVAPSVSGQPPRARYEVSLLFSDSSLVFLIYSSVEIIDSM